MISLIVGSNVISNKNIKYLVYNIFTFKLAYIVDLDNENYMFLDKNEIINPNLPITKIKTVKGGFKFTSHHHPSEFGLMGKCTTLEEARDCLTTRYFIDQL